MKIIILDRDGVINEDSDEYIKSPQEWQAIPGSLAAIAQLNQAGFHVLVATNQSGVGRGLFDLNTLHEIHAKLHRELAEFGGRIEAIFYCPHTPEENCDCRKPKPGLLLQIADRLNVDLANVTLVGDTLRDCQAARAAGATPVLVRTGKGERTLAAGEGLDGIPVYDSLAHFTDEFLRAAQQE